MSCFEIACKSQGSASLISPLLQGSFFFHSLLQPAFMCLCQVWKCAQGQTKRVDWIPWIVWTLKMCLNFNIMGCILISNIHQAVFICYFIPFVKSEFGWSWRFVVFLCYTYVLGDDKLTMGFTKSLPIHCPWRRCDVHIRTIQQQDTPRYTHWLTHRQPKGNRGHETHMSICYGHWFLAQKPQTKVLSYSSIFQEVPFDT